MKILPIALLSTAISWATPVDDFIASAKAKHGESGEMAARFLVAHMPTRDKETLAAEFLTFNLDLAFRARAEFPWAKHVPDEIFQNDVLPYAVFDETRERWRAEFFEKARPLVKDAKSASEAAQALNRGFFKLINVHYNTGRKAPNQSPSESSLSCWWMPVAPSTSPHAPLARRSGLTDEETTPGWRSGTMAGISPERMNTTPRASTAAGSPETPHWRKPKTRRSDLRNLMEARRAGVPHGLGAVLR